MDGVFLLLGSNLGDKVANLNEALNHLKDFFRLTNHSKLYESEPWGVKEQPLFCNQVLKGTTELSAEQLLSAVLKVESQMGRERKQKWGERLIDIDILYYGNHVIDQLSLKVPHPEIQN
ncbi:MAG: 2-amino-4-hydroxy-6-hydroxymethyldihydropteridine diphosphokinase, partial [Bacteroidota bacterium]